MRDLTDLKQLSATEAARRFSEVLDRVEQRGESVVIVRHGRAVATIGPAGAGTGKALKEVLRAHRPDPDLVDEVRELREFIGPAQDRWPG
ncbi:MAG TPA: type II toxin-antitoxin system prevent-host-death family antitoxin [Solirubrobacterales bacterium]|nr:type II toxin-antitoxin system prevent-host-death family antitoxin [Solirubrobacterales bacterium]